MERKQLIKVYLDFFKSKNHKIIPNESLIPKNDPTVLFTTAGMHPLVPYLLGQKHPLGKRLCNVQKCIRTGDIDEVGDDFHLTFFEMLGNWSLGDYWKENAIKYSFEFLTKKLNIPKEKITVTCFKGDKNAPKDTESAKIWESLGIKKSKIKFLGKEDNWWGPAGKTGPCGPSTEMFVDNIEIGNDVLMQYNKNEKQKYNPAKQKNIDFGGGVERTLAVLNNKSSVYEIEVFQPIMKEIEKLTNKKNLHNNRSARIIADHIKASVFILAEKNPPSNLGQGYVLRRLIRRAIRYSKLLGIKEKQTLTTKIAEQVFKIYPDYPELKQNKKFILDELKKEEEKFELTLEKGINRFNKLIKNKTSLSGEDTFLLFQSYGFPLEMTKDLAKEKNIKINEKVFEREFAKHQTISGASIIRQFKSGLADSSDKTKKLHTATHMLLAALREVLSEDIRQKGSNITPERLRLDFNFERKLTNQEIKKVENLMNKKIKQCLKVKKEDMSLKKALSSKANAEFNAKYPDIVSVYTIGNFSKEICTGPHVQNTKELGKFKIIKEESSSAGVRRVKAVLE